VAGTFSLDFNVVIAHALDRLILHWTPIRYARTATGNAGVIGPSPTVPAYGGIQGLMVLTVGGASLAGTIAAGSRFSNEYVRFLDLRLLCIITLFIPSAVAIAGWCRGGHGPGAQQLG